jgi:hypothetical protein
LSSPFGIACWIELNLLDVFRTDTGMVLHKDSKWYQSWQNFKENNTYINSKCRLFPSFSDSIPNRCLQLCFQRTVRVQNAIWREWQSVGESHTFINRKVFECLRRCVQVDRDERGAYRDRQSRAFVRVECVHASSATRHHTQHTRVDESKWARHTQRLVHGNGKFSLSLSFSLLSYPFGLNHAIEIAKAFSVLTYPITQCHQLNLKYHNHVLDISNLDVRLVVSVLLSSIEQRLNG